MIQKEELKQKILDSLTTQVWVATTTLANSIGTHPYRAQSILLELLQEEKVEEKLTKKQTYWRKNEIIEKKSRQADKISC